MCTVSFVAHNNQIIITSNRDEEALRPALPPQHYLVNNKQLTFPKDPRAGGTWCAVDENANVIVLLNGAAEKHQWNPPYRRSRGLIVLDLLGSDSAIQTWNTIDLDNVEPFTIILYEVKKLYQLRWNGESKDTVVLDANRNYIWSSAPLYSKEIREQRAEWFYKFMESTQQVDAPGIFRFHRYTENEDTQNGLVINRNNKLQTLSITQTVIDNQQVSMRHDDLIGSQQFELSFQSV